MSVNSKMTAIANAIRSLLGITGSLGLDAMATKLNGITKKAAQTYTPGKNGQTIAAGQYLTGAQTIAGDANLVPANIAAGVSIFGVAGEHSGGGETVEVTITNCDMNKVYYRSPDAEDGTLSEVSPSWSGVTITCLKNSIIVITDTYGASNSHLNNLTSTTGEVIWPSNGNGSNKVMLVMATQSGTIKVW